MESRGRTSWRRDHGSIANGSRTAGGLSGGTTGSVVTTVVVRGEVAMSKRVADKGITPVVIEMSAATEMDDEWSTGTPLMKGLVLRMGQR
jgi:hypothetical protein